MMKTIHSAYFWRISSFSGGEQTYFRASVPPYMLGCFLWLFWRVVWYETIPFEVNLDNDPP